MRGMYLPIEIFPPEISLSIPNFFRKKFFVRIFNQLDEKYVTIPKKKKNYIFRVLSQQNAVVPEFNADDVFFW